MMFLITLPLLATVAEAASRHGSSSGQDSEVKLRAQRISPELEPTSDKKFFKKDYAWDKRPVADKHYVFGHPYPAVQDGSDFDKDFVKDENSDGGRWQAQMDYDILRGKIRAAKEKLERLKEKMDKEYQDWLRAKERAADRTSTLEEARKAVEAARKAADEAAKRVNDLEGRSQKDGTKVGGAVGDAVRKVQDEMDDLEKCKEALAKAKQRLKDLLKEREEQAAKDEKAKAEEKKEKEKEAADEAEKEKEESKEKKVTKKDASPPKEKSEKKKPEDDDEAGSDEEKWSKKVKRDQAENDAWRKKYEKELEDVKKTEEQLARAAETLKKFRRPPHVDDNGGVYNVPSRSSAASARVAAAAALAVLAAALAA